MPFCTQCGVELDCATRFCTHCGAMQIRPSSQVEEEADSSPASPRRSSPSSPIQPQTSPSWKVILSTPEIRNRVMSAVGKSLLINGFLTALVIVPSLFTASSYPFVTAVWLFVGSFCLMARTYSRPWKLMSLTCLMPGLFAIVSWGVQWLLHRDVLPSVFLLMIAMATGLLFGGFRARSHEIYLEKGMLMARRTTSYLIVWALAYVIAQVLRGTAGYGSTVHLGLLASTFSSAMLVAMAAMIFVRFRAMQKQAVIQ